MIPDNTWWFSQEISEFEKRLTDHNHDKYITTPEFNKFTAEVFDERSARGNLLTKTDFDTKLISLNNKVSSNKTKHLLVENELKNYKHLIQFILEVRKSIVCTPCFCWERGG